MVEQKTSASMDFGSLPTSPNIGGHQNVTLHKSSIFRYDNTPVRAKSHGRVRYIWASLQVLAAPHVELDDYGQTRFKYTLPSTNMVLIHKKEQSLAKPYWVCKKEAIYIYI